MAYYATYQQDETGALQKVVINAGVGFVLPFYGETAPPGTLACDGSEISRTVYDELFQVLGTKAGAGDGSTTFNLPDLRGMFVRGTGGNAAALGTAQGDAIRDINGNFLIRRSVDRSNIITDANGVFSIQPGGGQNSGIAETQTTLVEPTRVLFTISKAVPTAAEIRPVNVALLWCIIYE